MGGNFAASVSSSPGQVEGLVPSRPESGYGRNAVPCRREGAKATVDTNEEQARPSQAASSLGYMGQFPHASRRPAPGRIPSTYPNGWDIIGHVVADRSGERHRRASMTIRIFGISPGPSGY
jgi:hypothetical protein